MSSPNSSQQNSAFQQRKQQRYREGPSAVNKYVKQAYERVKASLKRKTLKKQQKPDLTKSVLATRKQNESVQSKFKTINASVVDEENSYEF